MDTIDHAIMEAWDRLSPALRANRAQALRRAGRTGQKTLARPIRAWCCCIRANDTRIEDYADIDINLAQRHQPHDFFLGALDLRKLCKPVHLGDEEMPWRTAAAKLGLSEGAMRHRLARLARLARLSPGTHRRDGDALQVVHHRVICKGPKVPYVWSDSPLDPQADRGEAPDPAWGSLWTTLYEQIPEDASLTVDRVPISLGKGHAAAKLTHHQRMQRSERDRRGRYGFGESPDERRARTAREANPLFGGWRFVCPGLHPGARTGGARGMGLRRCGRHVRTLYLPIPPWCMLHMNCQELADQREAQRTNQWACTHCHNIHHLSLANAAGWGQFVAIMSGGLLTAREVKRPPDFAPTRRRRFSPKPRATPKRDQAVRLRSEGLTYKQIAKHMNSNVPAIDKLLTTARRASKRAA